MFMTENEEYKENIIQRNNIILINIRLCLKFLCFIDLIEDLYLSFLLFQHKCTVYLLIFFSFQDKFCMKKREKLCFVFFCGFLFYLSL